MAADVLSVIQDVLNQDKQQKREHAKVMREVQKKLNDKEVSEEEGDKEEYTAFVNKTLKKYGVKSPAELSPEDKKRFYNELDAGWKADDEKPEPEDKEEEVDLKTRVKDRMKAEQEDDENGEKPFQADADTGGEVEDDDEGDDEGDEGDGDEPSEEQIDRIADLVVKKLKDKVDDEEDEEEEPMKVGGDEEEIDTKPQAESQDPRFTGTQLRRSMGEALKQVRKNSLNEQDEWVDAEAKKVQHKWKRMNTRDRVKWLDMMDVKADKHNTSDADLEEILDDYGLTKEEVELDEEIFYWYLIRGNLETGKVAFVGTEKQVKLKRHDPKFSGDYVMTKSRKQRKMGDKWKKSMGVSEEVEIGEGAEKDTKGDKEAYQKFFQAALKKFGVDEPDQLKGDKKKEFFDYIDKGWKADNEKPEPGDKKEEVEIDEGTSLQVKMALDDVGLKGKWKNGKVYVKKSDVEKAEKALKGNVLYKGKTPVVVGEEVKITEKHPEHKCPTHVKRETKEGYEYGRNISHTISEDIVDFINIIWLDSQELQEMIPIKNVEVISELHHGLKNHREKFKATTKIAEAYARLPQMDKEKYQKRTGLEGPIMTASGKVLYFDPKYTGEDGSRGTYYDPDSDWYIDYKTFKAYDDTSKLKFYKSPFDDPDSKEWKKLQKDRERFEKSLLKGTTKRSKKDRLKLESTGLKFARKFYQKGEQDVGSEE